MTETEKSKTPNTEHPTPQSEFMYEIGGKKYTQSKLVLGQIEQLIEILSGTVFHGVLNTATVMMAIGSKISTAIAITLKEEGQGLENKNVDKLAKHLRFRLDSDTTIQIVDDFFLCNPIASLSKKLVGMITRITESVNQIHPTGSSQSSSLSQKEISPSETESSGVTPSKSANLTSNTATEK